MAHIIPQGYNLETLKWLQKAKVLKGLILPD